MGGLICNISSSKASTPFVNPKSIAILNKYLTKWGSKVDLFQFGRHCHLSTTLSLKYQWNQFNKQVLHLELSLRYSFHQREKTTSSLGITSRNWDSWNLRFLSAELVTVSSHTPKKKLGSIASGDIYSIFIFPVNSLWRILDLHRTLCPMLGI